jgi:hypothetical protein
MADAVRRDFVAKLLDEWQALRAEIRALEELEHPPIVDHLGREWTWKDGDLYRHDSTAAPRHMINNFGWPRRELLDNPNYRLCDACRANVR